MKKEHLDKAIKALKKLGKGTWGIKIESSAKNQRDQREK